MIYTTEFDQLFESAALRYFPASVISWKVFKAQGIAESGLSVTAKSPAGAIGIMQFMPATAQDLGVDPLNPDSAIMGAVKYDHMLYTLWISATMPDRMDLAFASYNAGYENIRKAANLAKSIIWADVAKTLPQVTGSHATETIGYVARINALVVTI